MTNLLKDQIAKSREAAQERFNKSTEAARKGFRAYIGFYGTAYDRLVPAVKTATQSYDQWAEKGAELEKSAQTFAETARSRATKSYEGTVSKVRSVLPRAANDRVEELEAEIARLNKKITTLAKKAPKKVAKPVVKTATKAADVTKAA